MPLISVTKCHGTGNDFLLLDARASQDTAYGDIAKALCHRRFGIGADGLLVLGDAHNASADAALRTFNADGTEAEMCGNGIRCLARYLYEENPERVELTIETLAGTMETNIVTWNGRPGVRVGMGTPKFVGAADGKLDRTLVVEGESAPAYAVSMGNPHVAVFITRDPADVPLRALAETIKGWKAFPDEPNVEIAQVGAREIAMRVHERGVGETWACGTGACATAAAAIVSGRVASPATVLTKGGSARVQWAGSGQPAFLTGDAELVFRTEVDLDVVARIHSRAG